MDVMTISVCTKSTKKKNSCEYLRNSHFLTRGDVLTNPWSGGGATGPADATLLEGGVATVVVVGRVAMGLVAGEACGDLGCSMLGLLW